MGRWLARRLIITLVTFIGFTMIIFTLMRLSPVSPVDLMLFNLHQQGGLSTADIVRVREQLSKELGLDLPIPLQYVVWLKTFVTTGSLGFSFITGRPALDMVVERMPPTLLLLGSALIIELLIGIPLGILAALRRNRWVDYVVSSFGLSVVAIPTFFLGLAAIYVFAVKLGVLPSGGMFTPTLKTFSPIDWIRHLIMPALILGLAGVGPILRYVRTSILETLGKEYLVTARAKGLPVTLTVIRHAFPNALLPLVTYVGIQVGTLMAGAFVVEQVFNWPGMGSLALSAIQSKDYPVIQAFAVVTGILVLLGNVFADLAYGVADPRIRQA
ncbi:MAG TPA: ABC transporter permease [Candidatus Saccharimonadales bacterium]|nr:ABC transporter permease [Candidatus Saccharimonadales bacterium]